MLKLLGIGVGVVVVSALTVAGAVAVNVASTISEKSVALNNDEPPPSLSEIDGPVDIFLAGTDACEPEYAAIFGDRCTGSDANGELNDVNILVRITDNPRRVTAITFPRDLMVPIPSCTNEEGVTSSSMSKQQINTAYYYGGLPCIVDTIEQLTGIENIPFAAKVTWGGVIEITNAIGGVEVCLANGIKDPNAGIDWPAGDRSLQGVEALAFLRTRHGVGDGSDLGRVSNQQLYMSNLVKKMMSSEVLSDVGTLSKLANTVINNVSPSTSLNSPVTLAQIALAVKDVPIEEITFVQYPVFDDPADKNRLVPDYASARVLLDALNANEPLQIDASYGENAGIIVEGGDESAVEGEPGVDGEVDPNATVAPDGAVDAEGAVVLPENVRGVTAADSSCSNGNVRTE